MTNTKVEYANHLKEAQDFLHDLQKDDAGFFTAAKLLKDLCGISLDASSKNKSLMASRLSSVLRQKKLSGYNEYLNYLRLHGAEAQKEFVSAMTTNTTQFFRESAHFTHLCSYLPTIMQTKLSHGESELRVWCAAASTGQEPYSILINLFETLPNLTQWNLKFLATDIDQEVLKKASNATYTEDEMESMPPMFRMKYFDLIKEGDRKQFQLKKEFANLIRFAEFNLLTEPYPFQYKFDVVFCRNVLIYFERHEAERVVNKILSSMNENGILFLGHSEGGLMHSNLGESIGPATYLRSAIKIAKVRGIK
jgi:chemotaxis protein methyltransferase CheR